MVFYEVKKGGYWKVSGIDRAECSTKINPNNQTENVITGFFEGFLEKGLASREPKFGRFYDATARTCKVGYFSQLDGEN